MNPTDITNQTIFQQSPISTQIFLPNGETLMANKAWEKLWNVKHDQIGKYNVLKDEQLAKKGIMKYIKRGFKGEIVHIPPIKYEPDQTLVIKNASPYKWVRALIYPVRDKTNKIVHVVLQHEDITDQVEYELMLRASEEKLKFQANILQNITNSVITTDVKGAITYWNKGAEKIFGYKANEMLGRTLDILYPELDVSLLAKDLKKINKGQDYVGEWRGRKKNGKLIWVTIKTTVLLDISNKPIGFIGVAADITKRREVEEELRKNEERFRLAVNAGKVGVWDWDILTNTVIWSEKIYEIHGLKKHEFAGTVESFVKLIHPDDAQYVNDLLQNALQNAVPFQSEFRARGPKGKTIWIYTSAMALFENNKPIRMLGATIDITERKNLEQQKDEFIGLASHELKTPLTSIKAFAQILEKSFAKKGDTSSAQLLTKMDKQINRLTVLIRDLLDVTRIQEGKLQFRQEHFAFNDLVHEITEEMQRTTDKHKIVLKLSKPVEIYGDRERYGQVIMNLLTNAIKYSPEEKDIFVTSKLNKNTLTFSVQDFGFGISKDMQTRIFERFFRVNRGANDTYSGLGLGLYISKEIITRQGGKIWVESEVGKGSLFLFSIPVNT